MCLFVYDYQMHEIVNLNNYIKHLNNHIKLYQTWNNNYFIIINYCLTYLNVLNVDFDYSAIE